MDLNVITDELPRDTAVVHQCKEKIPLPPDKKFHIFFSYRDILRDKLWVKRLINKLETEYGYTCCDHERDFLAGTNIMENIKFGVKNSEKVVVVFSKEAMDSQYVSLEAAIAFKQSLETRKNILIPVLLDDCDVPEEYMLLTYIDAREGVEEATWLPKLLKSLESTEENSRPRFHVKENIVEVDKTFAVKHLCSIETKYSYHQRSLQASSKYLPVELRPEASGIPAEIIRRIYKDLLNSPRELCRQKYWLCAAICVVVGFLGNLISLIICGYYVFLCFEDEECTIRAEFYFCFGFILVFFVSCSFGYMKCYSKNPNSVNKNIIEHNKALSKYGVMVTVVHRRMWYSASLIFYTCTFELCKEYVIRHLAKEESTDTADHTHIPDSDQMVDLLLRSGTVEPNPCREQSERNVDAINEAMPEDAEDAENEPLLSIKETRNMDYEQSERNVDAINEAMPEEIEDADDEPLLSTQETRNMDYETKAFDMLMSCTPEYFTLVHAKKLTNPKEDRHGRDVMCLCQYLEKVDKDFRKKVKTTQSLRRKINIEEDDENNKHLKNISLY